MTLPPLRHILRSIALALCLSTTFAHGAPAPAAQPETPLIQFSTPVAKPPPASIPASQLDSADQADQTNQTERAKSDAFVSQAPPLSSPTRPTPAAPGSAEPTPEPTTATPSAPAPASAGATDATPAAPVSAKAPSTTPAEIPVSSRPPATVLEVQIALSRINISCGSLDGKPGAQTRAAILAFQESNGLDATGNLDDATRDALALDTAPLTTRIITAANIATLQPLSPTWLGKSQQTSLAYTTVLEMAAEQAHSNPALLRELNPSVDWEHILPDTTITVPDVESTRAILRVGEKAARVVIFLNERILQARAADGRLLAHFPVSIARNVEKRPVGSLHVKVAFRNPNYTFDPDVFPESAEGRELGRKLIIPPGPNNPVGMVWIGLDRPGYGIHGTPDPEKVGRTESHGCFRLANWNALLLFDMIEAGTEVVVMP